MKVKQDQQKTQCFKGPNTDCHTGFTIRATTNGRDDLVHVPEKKTNERHNILFQVHTKTVSRPQKSKHLFQFYTKTNSIGAHSRPAVGLCLGDECIDNSGLVAGTPGHVHGQSHLIMDTHVVPHGADQHVAAIVVTFCFVVRLKKREDTTVLLSPCQCKVRKNMLCVCVCVCLCVRVSVCAHACTHVCTWSACTHLCVYACMSVCKLALKVCFAAAKRHIPVYTFSMDNNLMFDDKDIFQT